MLIAFPEGKVAFPKEMTEEGSTGDAERLSKMVRDYPSPVCFADSSPYREPFTKNSEIFVK